MAMAKNYVSAGDSISLPAPTGGSVAGVPQVIGDLAVMPLQSGPKGTVITYRTCGAWSVPAAAGLKAGVNVSVLNGALVADGTADSAPYGKLLSDTLNGFAEVLIVQ
jgi:predicted RecA/RadA family phage recombinase